LGYLRFAELGDDFAATHIVSASATLLVAAPSTKVPVLARYPMGTRLLCGELSDCGKYLPSENGFVPRTHLSEIGCVAASPADLAEQLIGTPYSWGGRSGDSLDCSGLVQLVFGLKGIIAPRDADVQNCPKTRRCNAAIWFSSPAMSASWRMPKTSSTPMDPRWQ
jgi:hypothetical protein